MRTSSGIALASLALVALAGCSGSGSGSGSSSSAAGTPSAGSSTSGMGGMSGMSSGTSSASPSGSSTGMGDMPGMGDHTDGGVPPNGLMVSPHAKHHVGSTVTLTADHMPGMKGARAYVNGAFDGIVYGVTYTPTTGGAPVVDHKWVVQQEIQGAGTTPLKPGTPVTITADHMDGMKGAKGTVVEVHQETVYTVSFKANGTHYTNHKWVVDDEMAGA